MASNTSKPTTRESIVADIRSAVEENRGEIIGMESFLVGAKIRRSQFYKFFSTWQEGLRAAGFDFDVRGERVSDERLLTDWGEVMRHIQRAPTIAAYDIHGKFSSDTLRNRFDSYPNVAPAFEKFAKGKSEWADVLPICLNRPKRGRPARPLSRRARQMRMRQGSGASISTPFPSESVYAPAIRDRQLHGEPLQLPGLGYAPINECGVLYLFGMIGWRLGFHVESVRSTFPDCEAQRCVGPGRWQRVTIEFEYESRNFRDHAHDHKGCDLIVCWEHNWTECPKNLEVIALKEALERLQLQNPPLRDS